MAGKPEIQIISAWLAHHPEDMQTITKRDKWSLIAGIVLCVSILTNAYQLGHPKTSVMVMDSPGTSGSTNDSSKKPLFSVHQPINSLPIITNWISEACQNIFSFDFTNIDDHHKEIKKYFTEDGWDSFLNAMSDSASIESTVIENKNIANSIASEKAVLSQLPSDNVDSTTKHWVMQVPVIVTLSAGNRQNAQEKIYEFDIVEDHNSIYGRGINSVKEKN